MRARGHSAKQSRPSDAHEFFACPDGARWGASPWRIDFEADARALPEEADVAIVGGGFTGLAAAAWLARFAPKKKIVALEGGRVGAGASGRTGGMALAETAAGDLPGLGDVLAGFAQILKELEVDCDLSLGGTWEIGRSATRRSSPPRTSPIDWQDSGTLRVVHEVPGGTVDAGKLVSGLARAAQRSGAIICERTPVRDVAFAEPLRLRLPTGELRAQQVLFATNAFALELSGLADRAVPKFTLAVATAPLTAGQLEAIGLSQRKPFYTVDMPYLWGRVLGNRGVVFGSGLVHLDDWRELASLDVDAGEVQDRFAWLEKRVRGLHPALHSIEFIHRWGGPILFTNDWQPIFARHSQSPHALVLAGYCGHGVALSVYLGCWAAEVLLGQRELPAWAR